MKPKFVQTKNVIRFINLIHNLKNKPENITKIGLIYGNAGLGKTKTALYLSFQFDSIYIRATNKMTTKWFLEELAKELDKIPRFFTADIFRQCVNVLKNKSQMIIVDEVDYLLSDFKTIETLRDLHDETGIPIVLVGMSLAKHKLKKHTHLFDRISEIYQYTRFEYSDIKQIVDEISEVDMTKEVISAIHQKAKSFRKIVEVLKSNCFCRAYIAPFILGSSPILTKTPFVSFLSQLFFVYLDNSCLEKPCSSSHLVVTKALCGTFPISDFKLVSLSKPMVYILTQK